MNVDAKLDEIRYKARSSNVVMIAEAIGSLVELVGSDESGRCASALRELCSSEDAIVATTACHGLFSLKLDSATALSTIVAANTFAGVCSICSRLSISKVLRDVATDGTYECSWKIVAPVHPFVFVLQQHARAAVEVYDELVLMCSTESSIYNYCVEALRPLFVWTLCNPRESISPLFQYKLLNLLLTLNDVPHQKRTIVDCLSWQKISNRDCVHVYEIYSTVAEWAIRSRAYDLSVALFPSICSIAHEIISSGKNPLVCFALIRKLLVHNKNGVIARNLDDADFTVSINCSIDGFAETVTTCSPVYILNLVQLCKSMCEESSCFISKYMLISGLLQWEYNKNSLILKHSNELKDIIKTLNIESEIEHKCKSNLRMSEMLHYFITINRKLYLSAQRCLQYNYLCKNSDEYRKWFTWLKYCSNMNLVHENFLFLQTLLLTKSNFTDHFSKTDLFIQTLNVIKYDNKLAIGHLPVTLYFLKTINDPYQVALILYNLPELAVIKENVPYIVNILKTMEKSGTVSASLIINLYVKLIDKNVRCFPYLQEILIKATLTTNKTDEKWEILTAKANASKCICETRAISYGKDMVPILSHIISQSMDEEGTTACCLSINALQELWREKVIDPISTWQVLSSKFNNEKRYAVNISICKLLGSVPNFYHESSEYDDLIDRSIMKLWKYIIDFENIDLIDAAFEALSKFSLKFMTMKQIPDIYKTGVKLPPNFDKIPSDVPKTIDDLTYIPCDVWGNLYKYTKTTAIPSLKILCYNLIQEELSGYRGGVYNIIGNESETAKYLPVMSVVRGLMEFVRKEVNKFSESANIGLYECLKCLSLPTSKTLPPINWCFLTNILHEEEIVDPAYKRVIICLLVNQVETSPSAMKMLEDYIQSLKNNNNELMDMELVFLILHKISKLLKLSYILPVLQSLMQEAYSLSNISHYETNNKNETSNSEDDIFKYALTSLSECIKDHTIQENVRDAYSDLLVSYWNVLSCDEQIWPLYISVCSNFSDSILKKILYPINEKSSYLRFKLALNDDSDNSLDWLNDVIDEGINCSSYQPFIFKEICNVLFQIENKTSSKNWAMKLMIKIQSYLENDKSKTSVIFLLNIFIITIVKLSKHYIFNENDTFSHKEYLEVFPYAVSILLDSKSCNEWKSLGHWVLQWINTNLGKEQLPKNYAKTLYITILVNRNNSIFENYNIWAEYASIKSFVNF